MNGKPKVSFNESFVGRKGGGRERERERERFSIPSLIRNTPLSQTISIPHAVDSRNLLLDIKFLIKFRAEFHPTIGSVGTSQPRDPGPKTGAKKYLRAWPRKWAINGNRPAIIGIQGVGQLFPKSRQYPFNFQDYSRRFELITRDRE